MIRRWIMSLFGHVGRCQRRAVGEQLNAALQDHGVASRLSIAASARVAVTADQTRQEMGDLVKSLDENRRENVARLAESTVRKLQEARKSDG